VVLSLGLSDPVWTGVGLVIRFTERDGRPGSDLLPRLGVNSARQLGDAANAGGSSATIPI
jgi:hypothetical protein